MNPTQAPVYLSALGMVNALGGSVDEIAAALRTGVSPGMGPHVAEPSRGWVGMVRSPLETTSSLERATARWCGCSALVCR